MSKERAACIANSPSSSSRGGKRSGSGGNSKQGGTAAQYKAAGREGDRAAAKSLLRRHAGPIDGAAARLEADPARGSVTIATGPRVR